MTSDMLALPETLAAGQPTSTGARRVVAPLLIGTCLFISSPTSAIPPIAQATFASAGQPTSIGGYTENMRLLISRREIPATAEAVQQLHVRSGLTWDELARTFGVSRRAVHAWASGTRLNQEHAARLSYITRAVDSVDAGDPVITRAALHAPASDGVSLYQRLIRLLAQPGNRREGFTPWELLLGRGEQKASQDS
jgi:DNA-binding XRE family transcriptional regulator